MTEFNEYMVVKCKPRISRRSKIKSLFDVRLDIINPIKDFVNYYRELDYSLKYGFFWFFLLCFFFDRIMTHTAMAFYPISYEKNPLYREMFMAGDLFAYFRLQDTVE